MTWVDEILESKIDVKQFGGRPGMSTTDALVEMVHNCYKTTDALGTYVSVIFLDFAKAFDLIIHEMLLKKLKDNDIPPHILRWMASFLLDRTQRVKIGKYLSNVGKPNGGVPQGTVSGPRDFILHINDLDTTAPMYKYVDDTTIFEMCNDDELSTIQESINTMVTWTDSNDLRLNVDKCKEMIIDFSINHRHTVNAQSINIGDQVLDGVESAKILGVTISSDLTWSTHVDNIIQKGKSTALALYELTDEITNAIEKNK